MRSQVIACDHLFLFTDGATRAQKIALNKGIALNMTDWGETWAFWLLVHCAFYFMPCSMSRGSKFVILNIISAPVAENNYVFSIKGKLIVPMPTKKKKVTVRSKRMIETSISETFDTPAFSSLFWMPSLCQTLWSNEWSVSQWRRGHRHVNV